MFELKFIINFFFVIVIILILVVVISSIIVVVIIINIILIIFIMFFIVVIAIIIVIIIIMIFIVVITIFTVITIITVNVTSDYRGAGNQLSDIWRTGPELEVSSANSHSISQSCPGLFSFKALTREGEDGATPLHYAARFRAVKLKPSNVHVQLTDEDLSRLEHELEHNGNINLALQPDESAAKPEEESLINILVTSGADVNYQDKYGWTPLHFAASKCNILATEELLAFEQIEVDVSLLHEPEPAQGEGLGRTAIFKASNAFPAI